MASIRASHILIMYEGSAGSEDARSQRTKEEAAAEIADLKSQIEAGADFAETAKEKSDCPSSEQGGDLGKFGKGEMVPSFDKAAFALSAGELSDVIETDFGFHIIQRTD